MFFFCSIQLQIVEAIPPTIVSLMNTTQVPGPTKANIFNKFQLTLPKCFEIDSS